MILVRMASNSQQPSFVAVAQVLRLKVWLNASLTWKLAQYFLEPWKMDNKNDSFMSDPAQIIRVLCPKCEVSLAVCAHSQLLILNQTCSVINNDNYQQQDMCKNAICGRHMSEAVQMDLRHTQHQENHAWFQKLRLLFRASDIRKGRGESTTTALFNYHNSLLYSKIHLYIHK